MPDKISNRIRCKSLIRNIASAATAASALKDGMTVATHGNALDYPKAVFAALTASGRQEEKKRIKLISSGPLGPEMEEKLLRSEVLSRRVGAIGGAGLRKAVNEGSVDFLEAKSGTFSNQVAQGCIGKVDFAVIEAIGIQEDGQLIPSTVVADAPTWAEVAEHVIVEINTSIPPDLEGIHDIYLMAALPHRVPIPLCRATDRIGSPWIPVSRGKIRYIVESDQAHSKAQVRDPAEKSIGSRIAGHLIEFFRKEVADGRLPRNLLPLEFGIGGVAQEVLHKFSASEFENIIVYSPPITDGVLDLIDEGKVQAATGTNLRLSAEGWRRFCAGMQRYKERIVLRPINILNSAEVIQRMGVISINEALEADIYGQVNSSMLMGGKIVGGIAGAYDFSRNAFISIFVIPSAMQGGKISTLVPMVSRVDHTEHEVDVIVTEQGFADLRFMNPHEKARVIIECCAHPGYRGALREYLKKAESTKTYRPVALDAVFQFHTNFQTKGTMLG